MALSEEEITTLSHIADEAERAENEEKRVALLLSRLFPHFRGRVAVISSFGAESAVLLAQVAEHDKYVPVFFLDTQRHFPETLAYREELTRFLDLQDVRILAPNAQALKDRDPQDQLAGFDPDACCALRKVEPLDAEWPSFDIWITGRKRSQAATRAALPIVEPQGDGHVKLNPLAGWTHEQITTFMKKYHLPPHPLVSQGYLSIGCAPCTRPVGSGEDSRAGRWAGKMKTECGIHRPVTSSASR
ncbi:phosphoadenylyl-sulfate reductase [Saccharibacter sp. 17.LH.SD]|uniref:phosphoadenylyl-sulfate reductase n=1 Tax=Saccharibacter sp. 17.LH.SD TaxID=2689393 RepID=UPI001370E5A0|nr:phosphoadenylyl-sulfate reductase [Saccharibacter sp. 17.LH.SD]MXV45236.1 phosphoadenylyl-sulfate reductase [Saccharibacter sp. 17.LH.SD]